jgi:hypothetical protein
LLHASAHDTFHLLVVDSYDKVGIPRFPRRPLLGDAALGAMNLFADRNDDHYHKVHHILSVSRAIEELANF